MGRPDRGDGEGAARAGVSLGDVKPKNVIVGASRDAALVDFGGGCSHEYIDPALADTKEGGLQSLAKLTGDLLETRGGQQLYPIISGVTDNAAVPDKRNDKNEKAGILCPSRALQTKREQRSGSFP